MYTCKIDQKNIEIFYNENDCSTVPVIILNTFNNEGNEVWQECQKQKIKDFILVAISEIDWNDDMTPWECPPLYKGDSYCHGYADKHLKLIEEEITPTVQKYINDKLQKKIAYFGIAGYSLGGLFAVYSGYKTNIFKRIISASGSMWYPNFSEYVISNKINKNIDKIYFSLGNKEKESKIKLLQTVEDKTKEIQNHLGQNITSVYEENEGNHFQDTTLRVVKGIKWILQ